MSTYVNYQSALELKAKAEDKLQRLRATLDDLTKHTLESQPDIIKQAITNLEDQLLESIEHAEGDRHYYDKTAERLRVKLQEQHQD